MPAFPDILAGSALAFTVATWVAPPIHMAFWKTKATSLAKAGQVIGFFVLAACLSAVALLLALLTLLFTPRTDWGWYSVIAVLSFWVVLWAVLYLGSRNASRRPDRTGQ